MLKKSKKGFTIVELVIVIAVIGILSAILIPTFANLTTQAQQTAQKANLAQAYSLYAADAADGFYGDPATSTIELKFKGQEDVFLVEKNPATTGKVRGFVYEANGWNTQDTEKDIGTGTGKVSLVCDTLAHSLYGGFTVYFINK